MQPGDAIAFGGTERNGRRAFAFAYELRGTTPPRDVFVAKTSQENGTFGAVECAKPAACLGVTRRIWLVTATAPGADPYSGMNSATKNLLAAEFTGVEVGRAERVRVLLLERRSDS
jgi:mannosyltransferase